MADRKLIGVEHAHIIWRNFRGEERKYNKKGDRNFNLVLDREQARVFRDEGFNVRERPPRDEGDDPQYLLQVSVNFDKGRPPEAILVTKRSKTRLNADTVGELDYAELENVDVTIRPYHWELDGGRSGVKAYLNKITATLLEDEFDEKYADIPWADRG